MKEIFLMVAFFAASFATITASARGGSGDDPAQMRQRMAERIKSHLIEKQRLRMPKQTKCWTFIWLPCHSAATFVWTTA